ncbi:hypothetical protein HK097_003503, partial [Rhizophlyctis rosea]
MPVVHQIPALKWSDGTESQHPASAPLEPCDPSAETNYLAKLGAHLAVLYNEHPHLNPLGNATFSHSATLASLPAGYKMFEQARTQGASGGKHKDRYLFGHPG